MKNLLRREHESYQQLFAYRHEFPPHTTTFPTHIPHLLRNREGDPIGFVEQYTPLPTQYSTTLTDRELLSLAGRLFDSALAMKKLGWIYHCCRLESFSYGRRGEVSSEEENHAEEELLLQQINFSHCYSLETLPRERIHSPAWDRAYLPPGDETAHHNLYPKIIYDRAAREPLWNLYEKQESFAWATVIAQLFNRGRFPYALQKGRPTLREKRYASEEPSLTLFDFQTQIDCMARNLNPSNERELRSKLQRFFRDTLHPDYKERLLISDPTIVTLWKEILSIANTS